MRGSLHSGQHEVQRGQTGTYHTKAAKRPGLPLMAGGPSNWRSGNTGPADMPPAAGHSGRHAQGWRWALTACLARRRTMRRTNAPQIPLAPP
jgi:hypothetical protein